MKIVFDPRAVSELEEARAWYEAQQSGLGDMFVARLRATVERITRHLGLASRVDEHLHRVLINRFPYAVIYALSVESDQAIILAIAHLHRHPRHQRPT